MIVLEDIRTFVEHIKKIKKTKTNFLSRLTNSWKSKKEGVVINNNMWRKMFPEVKQVFL